MAQAFIKKIIEQRDTLRKSRHGPLEKMKVQYQMPKGRHFAALVTGKELENLQDPKRQASIGHRGESDAGVGRWFPLEMKQ